MKLLSIYHMQQKDLLISQSLKKDFNNIFEDRENQTG